jgi:hypothetical protein
VSIIRVQTSVIFTLSPLGVSSRAHYCFARAPPIPSLAYITHWIAVVFFRVSYTTHAIGGVKNVSRQNTRDL